MNFLGERPIKYEGIGASAEGVSGVGCGGGSGGMSYRLFRHGCQPAGRQASRGKHVGKDHRPQAQILIR